MEELNPIRPVPTPTPVASLPADVPEGVQLVDEAWLAAQTADGARLILLEPEEFARREARLEETERRVEVEQRTNRALLATVAELEHRCAESEKELHQVHAELEEARSEHASLVAETQKFARRAEEREAAFESARSAQESAELEVTQLKQMREEVDQQLEATLTVLATTRLEAEQRQRVAEESRRKEEESRRRQEESETRARQLQGALASSQIEVQYLQRQVELAARPLSKKIMRRD